MSEEMQGILCKRQNFVVAKAKHLCLHLSRKQNMCVCLSFILDLVSSGSSGSVKSWDQCYCSWYAKMNLWSRARPRNLAPLPSPGADWLPQHSREHPCVSKCLTIQGHLAPRGVKRGKGQLAPASLENVEWWILKSVFPVSWTL